MDLGFAEDARAILDARFAVRERGIAGSRKVIRASANGIRALHRGEWEAAAGLVAPEFQITDESQALDKALRFWGQPTLSEPTRDALIEFCDGVAAATPGLAHSEFRAQRQNALRMLIATSPDLQTC